MKSKHLFFLFILSFSCKSPDNKLYEFYPRSLEENKMTLAKIADDIDYIPLDNSFPIGVIYENIEFINNSVYLSARDIGILVFDKEGKILRKIGSVGRGPGEYVVNFLFTVDQKTETVYVWDSDNIIKAYSKTGKYIRSFSPKEYGTIIAAVESFDSKLFVAYYINYDDVKYDWIFLDTLGKIIKTKERTIPTFMSGWYGSYGTDKVGNNMLYWNSYNDTVFSILPDLSYQASFIISPGEHRVPRSNFNPVVQFKQYMHIYKIIETSRFIMIRYYYKKQILLLVEKNNRNTSITDVGPGEAGGIFNDLDGGTKFLPKSYFVKNGREYLCGLLNPLQIKTLITSSEFQNSNPKYPEKKKDLEKLANNLKETDNPVLMIVRLKK